MNRCAEPPSRRSEDLSFTDRAPATQHLLSLVLGSPHWMATGRVSDRAGVETSLVGALGPTLSRPEVPESFQSCLNTDFLDPT